MATFVSNAGVWRAGKEKVGGLVYKGDKIIKKEDLPKGVIILGDTLKPGDPFMYEGPDRSALSKLHSDGVESNGEVILGGDFRNDPDFLQALRNRQFNSVSQFLRAIGFDEKEEEKKYKEKFEKTMAHSIPEQVESLKIVGGGKSFVNSTNYIGGFGKEELKEG